jgi:hypothetical protein
LAECCNLIYECRIPGDVLIQRLLQAVSLIRPVSVVRYLWPVPLGCWVDNVRPMRARPEREGSMRMHTSEIECGSKALLKVANSRGAIGLKSDNKPLMEAAIPVRLERLYSFTIKRKARENFERRIRAFAHVDSTCLLQHYA